MNIQLAQPSRSAKLLIVGGYILATTITSSTAVASAAQPTVLRATLTTSGHSKPMRSVPDADWFEKRFEFTFPPAESLADSKGEPVAEFSTTASRVKRVHEATALTWDQLARMFGVSRRSVHLWASTGKMNANNESVLAHIEQIVGAMQGMSPQQRRSEILDSSRGESIFARVKSGRFEQQLVHEKPYAATELMGA